jgi:hypothetical protein
MIRPKRIDRMAASPVFSPAGAGRLTTREHREPRTHVFPRAVFYSVGRPTSGDPVFGRATREIGR